MNEKKINLNLLKSLIFYCFFHYSTDNYLQRTEGKEISAVKLKSILKQINKKSSLKLVGRNQIVFGFIMFYLSSLQITRRFLFLVHKEESKRICKAYNQLNAKIQGTRLHTKKAQGCTQCQTEQQTGLVNQKQTKLHKIKLSCKTVKPSTSCQKEQCRKYGKYNAEINQDTSKQACQNISSCSGQQNFSE